MFVRITRADPAVELPAYQTSGSVAFDLAPSEDCVIVPRSMALVSTGLIIATPPGYALLIAARSSLFKKKGLLLANSVGVVDQDYCGPEDILMLPLWNPGDTSVHIARGERLAQGFFTPIERAEWQEGPAITNASRGGHGSTGL